MEVTEDELKEVVPSEFDVDRKENILQVYAPERDGANISFGVEDGTQFATIDYWNGDEKTIYEGQEQTSEDLIGYEAFNKLFAGEDSFQSSKVETILMEGLREASETSNKEEASRSLVNSAEDAYEILEAENKTPTKFDFNSKLDSTLGNANITYGTADSIGVEKIGLDMTPYDREYATSAGYIIGVVLLQDSNNKPKVQTGLPYKKGSNHHEEQDRSADMGLVETATEVTRYDFLN